MTLQRVEAGLTICRGKLESSMRPSKVSNSDGAAAADLRITHMGKAKRQARIEEWADRNTMKHHWTSRGSS